MTRWACLFAQLTPDDVTERACNSAVDSCRLHNDNRIIKRERRERERERRERRERERGRREGGGFYPVTAMLSGFLATGVGGWWGESCAEEGR